MSNRPLSVSQGSVSVTFKSLKTCERILEELTEDRVYLLLVYQARSMHCSPYFANYGLFWGVYKSSAKTSKCYGFIQNLKEIHKL